MSTSKVTKETKSKDPPGKQTPLLAFLESKLLAVSPRQDIREAALELTHDGLKINHAKIMETGQMKELPDSEFRDIK